MFSIKDLDVSLADIKSTSIVYMAVKDLLFYPSWKPPRLPLEYQEVEYVGSTGTQYIDTWINQSNCPTPIVEYKFRNNSSAWCWMFWFWGGTNNKWFIFWIDENQFKFVSQTAWTGLTWIAYSTWWHTFTTTATQWKVDWTVWYSHPIEMWVGWYNLYLFRTNNFSSTPTSIDVSYCKISKPDWTVLRNLIPCYRRIDDVVWFYDLVEKRFYANAGSWSFSRGGEVRVPELPMLYQETIYVQSSWTQYIDSWLTLETSARLDNFQMRIKATHTWSWNFAGTKSATDSPTYMTMEVPNSYPTTLRCFTWNSSTHTDRVVLHDNNTTIDDMRYTYSSSSVVTVVNGTSYSDSRNSWYSTGTHPVYVFGRNSWDNTSEQLLSMKLYSCLMVVNWKLERFLVPCYRKSDDTIWLFDLVNKEFYTNQWSWKFSHWPEIRYRTTSKTLLYLPVSKNDSSSSVIDNSLRQNNATWYWTAWYETLGSGKRVLKFSWAQGLYLWNKLISWQPYTIAMWIKRNWNQTNDATVVSNQYDSWYHWQVVSFNDSNKLYTFYWDWTSWVDTSALITLDDDVWYQYTITVNWKVIKKYLNNVLVQTVTNANAPVFTNSTAFSIWFLRSNWSDSNYRYFVWRMADLIVEDGEWSEEKRLDFFEKTKGDYEDKRENYQEVEYIQSTGTQWIDSWYIPKSTSWFEMKFQNVSAINTYRTLIWTRTDTANNAFWIWWMDNKCYMEFSPANIEFTSSSWWFNTGVDYEMSFLNKTLICNWVTMSSSTNFTHDAQRNLYILSWNSDWKSQPFEASAAKLYYLKLYEWEVLVRDFVPCYRISDWTVWLWDKVSKKFFGNKWTWAFWKWAAIIRERDVTFCEYIQSSGTQYIDTKVQVNQNYTTEIKCKVNSYVEWNVVMWTRSKSWYSSNAYNRYVIRWNWWSNNKFQVCRSYNNSTDGYETYESAAYYNQDIHTFKLNRYLYIDWELVHTFTDNSSTWLFSYAPTLFAQRDPNNNPNPCDFFRWRIYYCKIRDDNGNLVRNFKPCYITATWEAGLWDDVGKKFYWNNWTGSFAWDGTPQYKEYSYDFRNKSWSTVQNDWWTLLQWTSWTTINSSWIVMPTRWQWAANKVRIYRSEDLSNAKKITLQATYNWSTSDWWNSFDFSTRQSSNFDTWWTSIAWWTTTASWYVSRWSASTPNTGLRYNNSPSSWTWTSTAEFDLVNKTITFTRNWLETLTWTISDADISTIKSGNRFAINWGHDTWSLSVQSIYYKIEY